MHFTYINYSNSPLLQVLTAGILRKAALVKRQKRSQREVVMVNYQGVGQQSCLCELVSCGHCVLPWGLNQLGVLAGGSVECKWCCSSRDEIRDVVLPPQLWLAEFSLECSCPPSFSVDGASWKCNSRAGELLLWQQERCTNVELFHVEPIICFLNDLCLLLFASWRQQVGKIFGCWHIKLHNLHFLVEEKAKENALKSLCVESRNVVQGSVITWGMA